MTAKQERIKETASSLADQLSLLFPNHEISYENDVKLCLQNLIDSYHERETNADSFSLDYSELLAAMDVAVQDWKTRENKPETGKPSSTQFSLLDQLNGGFALPVTAEEIHEASSTEERLSVLKKITYAEDLLEIWGDIKPLLKTELLTTSDNVASEYLRLHRKWFDQSRSSIEYIGLQYDLCQNLMDVVCDISISLGSSVMQDSFICELIENWHDMFLDLVQRGHYDKDLVGKMELNMILILKGRPTNPSDTESSSGIGLVHILALIDPLARWFRGWTDLVSPQHMVSLLERTGLVACLLNRSYLPTSESQDDISVANDALRMQSIVILSSILGRTRIVHFPWHLLQQPPSSAGTVSDFRNIEPRCGSNEPGRTEVTVLLDAFIDFLRDDIHIECARICITSIELILHECKRVGLDWNNLLSKVEARVNSFAKDDDSIQLQFAQLKEAL